MSMAFLPHLEKSANPSITNSGSFSSAVPAYDILPYATAKAALNQTMVSLAHIKQACTGEFDSRWHRCHGRLGGRWDHAEMQERLSHPDNLIGRPT